MHPHLFKFYFEKYMINVDVFKIHHMAMKINYERRIKNGKLFYRNGVSIECG